MELCLNSNTENAKRYLKYFMHRINLLKHYKITPVVVLDGGSIPCKSDTENGRHRQANLFSLLILVLQYSSIFPNKCAYKLLIISFVTVRVCYLVWCSVDTGEGRPILNWLKRSSKKGMFVLPLSSFK